jgi:site-specific recombinase XerD
VLREESTVKFIIDDRVVLLRGPDGPLAPHIVSFSKWAIGQGYAPYSLRRRIQIAVGFSRWLAEKSVRLPSVSSRHFDQYLRYRERRRQVLNGDATALKQLLDFLRDHDVIAVEKIRQRRLSPLEQHVRAFERYLREERVLATATIVNYVRFTREFLQDCFGNGPVRLSQLCAGDVVRFVLRQAPRLHLKTAKLLTTALRSFLQYTRYRGYVRLDLAAAVPRVANWSMPAIPRAIAPDQVRRLLAQINRRTAVGRRDYAILLLLARLGLRSSEVVFLELDDIDWKDGSLSVHGKGGRLVQLPLPKDVGEAIAAYLQHGRPRSTSRRVFLRVKAPIRGFLGPSAVGTIVRHALLRAGIDAPTSGAHQFRHGLATEMLRHGASLSEIGELLGHRSPETTKIYTKVDIYALRTLALPWPGGVR